nr:relaxase/mobilization nuclease domain-containing protein [Hydrogenophaga sp. 2FB]
MRSRHQLESEALAARLRKRNSGGGKQVAAQLKRSSSKRNRSSGRASKNQSAWRSKGKSPATILKIHKGGLAADQYAEKSPGARPIDTNMLSLNWKDRAEEWHLDQLRHPGIKNLFCHVSISRPANHDLTDLQWRELGQQFLGEIGAQDVQYVSTLHTNTKNQHIHLLFSRSQPNGMVLSDSHNFYGWRQALRRAESKVGLEHIEIEREAPTPSTSDRQVSASRRARRRGTPLIHIDAAHVRAALAGAVDLDQVRQRMAAEGLELRVATHPNGEPKGLLLRRSGVTEWLAGTSIDRSFSLPKVQALLNQNRLVQHAQHQAAEHAQRAHQTHVSQPVLPRLRG